MKFPHFLTTPTGGVTRASAPAAEGQTVPTDAGSILSIALNVGAEILRAGGEIHRLKNMMQHVQILVLLGVYLPKVMLVNYLTIVYLLTVMVMKSV